MDDMTLDDGVCKCKEGNANEPF